MKQKLVISGLFAVTLAVVASVVYLNSTDSSKEPLRSPFASTFSIYSLNKPVIQPKYSVYGFLPYWTLDQTKYFQLDKLTDIAYFGLNIDKDGNFVEHNEDGTLEPGYNTWKNSQTLSKFIKTATQKHVRMALTIISHTDDISTSFLNCTTCWKTLATNITNELKAKEITGVNMNFEYVEETDADTAAKYTELVKFLKTNLPANTYIVVSTFADSLTKPRVTNVADLSQVADALFIMSYDFHRPNSDTAGPVAPINGIGKIAEYDITTMLKDYLAVSPANKLILGVPYYGYNWVVTRNLPNATRIPGNDDIGYSQSQTYDTITNSLLDIRPKLEWDELAQSPYFTYVSATSGSLRQVYYENEKSLKVKYELAKELGLAGVGIWALGYDGGYTELWNLLGSEFIF